MLEKGIHQLPASQILLESPRVGAAQLHSPQKAMLGRKAPKVSSRCSVSKTLQI
jgi:hypothetical protein